MDGRGGGFACASTSSLVQPSDGRKDQTCFTKVTDDDTSKTSCMKLRDGEVISGNATVPDCDNEDQSEEEIPHQAFQTLEDDLEDHDSQKDNDGSGHVDKLRSAGVADWEPDWTEAGSTVGGS